MGRAAGSIVWKAREKPPNGDAAFEAGEGQADAGMRAGRKGQMPVRGAGLAVCVVAVDAPEEWAVQPTLHRPNNRAARTARRGRVVAAGAPPGAA